MIASVSERQPDQILKRKGPAISSAFDQDGQPLPAATGFARSVGRSVEELERLKTDKGEWLFCTVERPGERLENLLFPMLEKSLTTLPVAKPMRWGSNEFSFVRPVHWLVVMHGTKVIPGSLMGLASGNTTRGHRIHSPGPHQIDTVSDYERVLDTAYVSVDQQKRLDVIRNQATILGKNAGGRALIDERLLEEVCNLVEWPRSICGSFDPEFLEVPAEALIASMQDHQKFFPVVSVQDGALMPRFIAVANLESQDFDAVRQGFERVIRPRLADARFFWEQDNKTSMEHWLPHLDRIVFQKNLGTILDKSTRISTISKTIAEETGRKVADAERAGKLCKCDLVSQMVGEFPELQGVMGRYYALQSGEKYVVAQAIGDHYLPAFSGDELPASATGKIVSLADRLDTLTGIFASGLKPSGNKDPFALRRAALGLIRILLDGDLDIGLDRLLEITSDIVQETQSVPPGVRLELRQFILERMRNYLRDQGNNTNVVNAVLDAPLGTLSDLSSRLQAVHGFMQLETADKLVEANKRIGNILRKSEVGGDSTVLDERLIIDEEKRLFEEIKNIDKKINVFFETADYTAALTLLAELSIPVEAFFEHVMVMDDDPEIRQNRLNLLARLKGLFDHIANFALVS